MDWRAASSASMDVLGRVLERDGYAVRVVDYPSTQANIETLAEQHLAPVFSTCLDGNIHVVTHSMGAILLRHLLAKEYPNRLGRVVMMGPSNHGSALVDTLGDLALFEWMNGEVGMQLGPAGIVQTWPDVDFELGVIAGASSLNSVFSAILPGKDDGKVTVASTKLNGMDDHIVLPISHTFMMQSPLALAQARQLLKKGRFVPGLDWRTALGEMADLFF